MTDAMRPVSPIPPARLATIRHHARWEQYVSKYPKYPLSIEPSISPRLSSLPSPPLLSSPLLSSPLLSAPLSATTEITPALEQFRTAQHPHRRNKRKADDDSLDPSQRRPPRPAPSSPAVYASPPSSAVYARYARYTRNIDADSAGMNQPCKIDLDKPRQPAPCQCLSPIQTITQPRAYPRGGSERRLHRRREKVEMRGRISVLQNFGREGERGEGRGEREREREILVSLASRHEFDKFVIPACASALSRDCL